MLYEVITRFPEPAAQARIADWMMAERSLVERLLGELAGAPLTELYRQWVAARTGAGLDLVLTSEVFSLAVGRTPMLEVLERFVTDYETLAGLYNEAVAEAEVGVYPLHTRNNFV